MFSLISLKVLALRLAPSHVPFKVSVPRLAGTQTGSSSSSSSSNIILASSLQSANQSLNPFHTKFPINPPHPPSVESFINKAVEQQFSEGHDIVTRETWDPTLL
jgi:hypothetical protein